MGKCYIKVTKNNTFITILSKVNEVIAQGSCGYVKMSGRKKRMPYSSELLGKYVAKKSKVKNCENVVVYIKSHICKNVRGALRGIISEGIEVNEINLNSEIAHNGVRLRKAKRR